MSMTFGSKVLRPITVAFAISLGALSMHTTMAGASEPPATRKVSYEDLDLSKQADAEALYLRIERAARKVCGGHDPVIAPHIAKTECYAQTIANAVSQVSSPLLTAVHARHTGRGERLARNQQ
jgi:UrcA family protein